MANNRPIRRGRFPRFRRRRRPQRWLDGNSLENVTSESTCTIEGISIECEKATLHELLRGETDADWSDKAAVTVDRIVGTLSVGYSFSIGPDPEFTEKVGPIVVLRVGVLQVEEFDEASVSDYSLFSSESLEKYQWMFLHQSVKSFEERLEVLDGTNFTVPFVFDIPVDIKTRRALSRKDSIFLMAQWATSYPLQNNPADPGYENIGMRMIPMLRCIVQS